jgi:hypothetical protein
VTASTLPAADTAVAISDAAHAFGDLAVKMIRWQEEFPGESGSPNKRADWLLAEMVPGLDKIRHIQRNAPSLDLE